MPRQTIRIRPQPTGIYAGTASALLLPMPTGGGWEGALSECLRGAAAQSANLPSEWQFYQAAVRGDINAAVRYLAASMATCDEEAELLEYNQFVLQPSLEVFQRLNRQLSGALACLLGLAAFNAGLVSELPAAGEMQQVGLDNELVAWGLATCAASELERENFVSARQTLAVAIEAARTTSPLLSAILIAQSAHIAHHCLALPAPLVQRDYESAIALAKEAALPGLLAELWTQLGMLLQATAGGQREPWIAAIRAYQTALQSGVNADEHPVLFAELHNNLGLAYLATPASETSHQLRCGIAIQSFRHAIEPLVPELHSDLWARIKMNLANALQYAPSSHPESNLIQAVQIYDEILEVRTRAREPVAHALVLLNQANALAHLGIFKPSLEKASEAYKLFQWYNQSEQAATARELVERVNDALSSPTREELSSSGTNA